MFISKFKVLRPVKRRNIVAAGAYVVADSSHGGGVQGGLFFGGQSAQTIKLINRIGVQSAEEFAFGIGPAIVHRAGNVNRAGSHQRDELVLIDGARVFVGVVFHKVVTEPMGEICVDALNRFAKYPP